MKTPQELAKAVRSLLSDEAYRREKQAAAERFVKEFCAYYGAESVRRIAEFILESKPEYTETRGRSRI